MKDSARDLKCVGHVSMLSNFNSVKGEIKFSKSTKEINGFKRAQIAEGLLDMLPLLVCDLMIVTFPDTLGDGKCIASCVFWLDSISNSGSKVAGKAMKSFYNRKCY